MNTSSRLHNRERFLSALTTKLGREPLTQPSPFTLTKTRQHDVLSDQTEPQQLNLFMTYIRENLGVSTHRIHTQELAQYLTDECLTHYPCAKGLVLLSQDARFADLSCAVQPLQESGFTTTFWQDDHDRAQPIQLAEQAKVGIVFAEHALVESGTIVLESSALQGRSISLLPEHSIFIIRRSSLLPRITQFCEQLHQRVQQGERLPSCVNFISGPSSTADIELIKVVGVHGPLSASYVILEDQ